MQVKGGVRVTQEVQEICTILDVLLVESGVGRMIYHLLLSVQPPDLDHLASRIESLKEVFCNRLELILESTT